MVIRIRADNPGAWFMHCHIELHSVDGMALVLNESYPLQTAPPVGFPTCGDFLYQKKEYSWPNNDLNKKANRGVHSIITKCGLAQDLRKSIIICEATPTIKGVLKVIFNLMSSIT